MKVSYELKIGDKVYYIEDEADSMEDFVRKIAPYQALEIEARGKTGVYLSYRKTADDDEYFALFHAETGTELHLGVRKDGSKMLFPGKFDKARKTTDKSWKPVLHGQNGNLEGESKPVANSQPLKVVSNEPPPDPSGDRDAGQEEQLTVKLRGLLTKLKVENAGQEKMKIKTALGLRNGLLLTELDQRQKFDLYDILFAEVESAGTKGRRAA